MSNTRLLLWAAIIVEIICVTGIVILQVMELPIGVLGPIAGAIIFALFVIGSCGGFSEY